MDEPRAEDLERARILGETGRIPWTELQRWFAGGMAIFVSSELDLVETAYQLSQDNAVQLREWMTSGVVDRVTDQQAAEWLETEEVVWAVVVKPWILVQPVVPGTKL